MLFNSFAFLLYLSIFMGFYIFILKRSQQTINTFLLIASVIFYFWWRSFDVLVLTISIFINFIFAEYLMNKSKKVGLKRSALCMGISFNLILLGYFKYSNFIKENINFFLDSPLAISNMILPLGISFFTFTQIAYLVDVFRNGSRNYSLTEYSLFVTYFPHLLAGPIIHHYQLIPQFKKIRENFNGFNFSRGLFLFTIGLFKKICIADTFSVWSNHGFENVQDLSFVQSWVTSLSYTFQLYFDFSGYSDMAIALALMCGIYFPTNFNSPYKAQNIQDFWRRWHITLSTFLRDYIYIPLGGNRYGRFNQLKNLFLTFLIGGIWHGAGWTFIVWGCLHGLYTILHNLFGTFFLSTPKVFKIFTTFMLVNIAWVYFRADNLHNAGLLIFKMLNLASINLELILSDIQNYNFTIIGKFPFVESNILPHAFIILGCITVFILKNSIELMEKFKGTMLELIISVFLFYLSITQMNQSTKFLYFNF